MSYACPRRKKDCKKHFLFFDVDNKSARSHFEEWIHRNFINPLYTLYETRNGFHGIIWKSFSFREAARLILSYPYVDLQWFSIGLKRGYWFLENRFPIEAERYMVIQRV